MGYYRVQRGDCLSSIAEIYGFAEYQTIYERPENAEFRQMRPNPNIIYPGDMLFIPDPENKESACATGQRHHFLVNRPQVRLRLCLKDDLHQPYQGVKYRLRVGFNHYQGTTDGGGMMEQEIPATASEGEITIFPKGNDTSDDTGYTFALSLGDLDPVEEISGIDARLINLGFGPAEAEESLSDEDRREAIKAFQDKFGLDATGELTEATKSKLRELHDGA